MDGSKIFCIGISLPFIAVFPHTLGRTLQYLRLSKVRKEQLARGMGVRAGGTWGLTKPDGGSTYATHPLEIKNSSGGLGLLLFASRGNLPP